MKSTRRSFLKRTALATAAISLPARIHKAAQGSNSDLRVAVVGFNGRGQSHISGYLGLSNLGVRLTALCDIDSKVLAKGVDQMKKRGQDVTTYSDIRKLLESKEVDMISI